ncbi:hypothetical protein Asi03nite_43760 [Actinoplanes siamensis]|uniref:Uncharacterized protein n=1 Tax=Actinoplanes siamensis TaxID=1223317 RepID=A0A919N978_9ACTN|nr:hypothetical protein Asi03nite_43760 [Actinoplanes siamensis]
MSAARTAASAPSCMNQCYGTTLAAIGRTCYGSVFLSVAPGAAGGAVAVVVDDDPAVVHRLRKEGFPVRLADWVPHAGSLRDAQEREGRT